jgi:hypothetical protein
MFSTPRRKKPSAAIIAALGVTTGLTGIGVATASASSRVTLVFTAQYNGNNSISIQR